MVMRGSISKYTLYPEWDYLQDSLLFYCPYDGKLPYETRFDVNTIPISGLVPTTAGGLIGRPAKWNKGVQCAEATTNLIENPSLETNLTWWSTTGAAGSAIARTYQYAKYGVYCTENINDGAAAFQGIRIRGSANAGTRIPGLAAGVDYTFSIWGKCTTRENLRMIIQWYNAAFGYISESVCDVLFETIWTYNSCIKTSPANTANAILQVRREAIAGYAWTAWFDAAQLEQKSYPTPYCDGSLGAGHSWAGVAHASASSRVATQLDNALTMPDGSWSISLWLTPVTTQNQVTADVVVLLWRFDNNNRFRLVYSAATNDITFEYVANGVTTTGSIYGSFTPFNNYHIVIVREQRQTGLYLRYWINNIHYDANDVQVQPMATAPNMLYVGNDNVPAAQCNGTIDDLAIFEYALSRPEISSIYRSTHALGYYANDDPTCDPDVVYVAPKKNKAQITHIFQYDASAGTYSENLLNKILPYKLFSEPRDVNDYLYIGCDTTLLDSGPFGSIVFELSQAFSNTGTWQYSRGGGVWSNLIAGDYIDHTDYMQNVGSNVLVIYRYNNFGAGAWSIDTINGVIGLWLRFSNNDAAANPIQINRHIYTVTWNSVNIPKLEDCLQELEMPLKLELERQYLMPNSRVFIARKTADLAEDYVSIINASDEQNPLYITVSAIPPAVFAASYDFNETGRIISHVVGGAGTTESFQIKIDKSVSKNYCGTHRLIARVYTSNCMISAKIAVGNINNIIYSTQPTIQVYLRCDLGRFTIPISDNLGDIWIRIYTVALAVGWASYSHIELYKIDERGCEIQTENPIGNELNKFTGILDCQERVKLLPYASLLDENDNFQLSYNVRANRLLAINPNNDNKLFFFSTEPDAAYDDFVTRSISKVRITALKRYLSLRGVE